MKIEIKILLVSMLFYQCSEDKLSSNKDLPPVEKENKENKVIENEYEKIHLFLNEFYDFILFEKSEKFGNILEYKIKDSVFVFDTIKIYKNIDELERTNYFSKKFISNLKRKISTLADYLKTGKIEYYVGEMSPFYYNGSPWCKCQDVPFKNSSSFIDFSEVQISEKGNSFIVKWNWKNSDIKNTIVLIKSEQSFLIESIDGYEFSSWVDPYFKISD